MPFPPNYGQERRSREVAKQRKAREKQMKRDEKSATRKQDSDPAQDPTMDAVQPSETPKDM